MIRQITLSRVAGFSLIEVLVAIFILATGVLGAAAMQMNALKFNQTASMRSQASFLAYEVIDSMRANPTIALAGGYDLAMDASASGTSINGLDLQRWRQALSQRLPAGKGSVAHNNSLFTVTIQWDESRLGAKDDPETPEDESLGSFTFVTEL